MPLTAAARIPTDRASRYLAQLCRHLGQMSRMRHRLPGSQGREAPPAVEGVDWSDASGTIRFSGGTCTLSATADALAARVEADDEAALRRLLDGIARRLETIGRRDRLAVRWQRSDSAPGLPADASSATPAAPDTTVVSRPRRLGRTLALVAIAVLAIAVHIGLLGGAPAASTWAGWGTSTILAIILLKVTAVGAHVLLERTVVRRRRMSHRAGEATPTGGTGKITSSR